jgi:putative ABC transport system ATP-binding protein
MADVHIENLVKEYGGGEYPVRPLDGVDLDVESGSLALLLGPSGCGKTTLLSCLGGILTPTSGSIRVGETAVTSLDGAALTDYRRHTVGIVFQAFNLIPSMTAAENVAAPLWATGKGRRESRKRALELLDRVGLAERAHHKPSGLSGGQQQRVAMARALALDPPLILADEPTAHLDFIQVEEVLRHTRDLASGDRVVVVSTHDHRMIPIADEVIEMTSDFMNLNVPPERVELDDDEVLFRQQSEGRLIYTVESGEIDILREHGDAPDELLTTLGAGEYFGEMAPLFGIQRSATARARGRAVVVGYTIHDFRDRVAAEGLSSLLDHRETTLPQSGD